MSELINGLHHVTAIAAGAQQNINFYVGVLGIRLVKKTINFDVPKVYHFYYGDENGNPGTLMTFFPYGDDKNKGQKGSGQVTVISFSVGPDSLEFWKTRLQNLNVPVLGPFERNDEEYLVFEDFDGVILELVANSIDQRKGWANPVIPTKHAVKGFYSVGLSLNDIEKTDALLTNIMGFKKVFQKDSFLRYEAGHGGPGKFLDVHLTEEPKSPNSGAGIIHHVAFSTDSDQTQIQIKEKLEQGGYEVTEVKDRQYFHSIYFNEPGGVLFEIATDPPGFVIDEDPEHLGESLKLPPWQEKNRDQIERYLKQIQLPVYT